MLIPNAPTVNDMADSNPIPEATYNLRIDKMDYVEVPKSSTAKGPYLKAQLVVTGPGDDNEHLGRRVFQNYPLFGAGSFRTREMLEKTGHPMDYKPTNTDELVGLEFGAAVGIEKGTGGYPDKNAVRKHLDLID